VAVDFQAMSIDYITAKDEIFGIANVAFITATQAASLTYQPIICFPGLLVQPPNVAQIYAECDFVVVTEEQSAFANVNGQRLYESVALFTMRLYAPKIDSASLRTAEAMAVLIKDAFRLPSPSGEIWFKRQRSSVVAGIDTKNQVNLVVTSTYKTEK
jgi:hypothetical protein